MPIQIGPSPSVWKVGDVGSYGYLDKFVVTMVERNHTNSTLLHVKYIEGLYKHQTSLYAVGAGDNCKFNRYSYTLPDKIKDLIRDA